MKITSCSSSNNNNNNRREDVLRSQLQIQLVLLDQKQKQAQQSSQARCAQNCRISTDPSKQTDVTRRVIREDNNHNNQHSGMHNSFKRINSQVISCRAEQQQIPNNDSRIKLVFNQEDKNKKNNNLEEKNSPRKVCSIVTQPTQQDSLLMNKQSDDDHLEYLQVSLSEITGWDNNNNSEENTTASQMEIDNLQEYYQRTYSQRNLKQCLPVGARTKLKEGNPMGNHNIDIESPNDLHSNSTHLKRDIIKSSKNQCNTLANTSHSTSKPSRKLVTASILRQRMQTSSASSPSVLNSLILPSQLSESDNKGLQFKEKHLSQPSSIQLSAKPQATQSSSQSSPFFSSLLLSNDRLLDNRKKSLAQFQIVRNIPEEDSTDIGNSSNTSNHNKGIRTINDKAANIDEDGSDKNAQSQMHNNIMHDTGEETTSKQISTNQSQEMIVMKSPKKQIKRPRGGGTAEVTVVEVVSSSRRDQDTHSPRKCIPAVSNRKQIKISQDRIPQRPHSTTTPKNHNHPKQSNSTIASSSQGISTLRFYDRCTPENPTHPLIQDNYLHTLPLPSTTTSPHQTQFLTSLSPPAVLIPSVSPCHPQLHSHGFPVVVLPANHLSSLLLPPQHDEPSQLSQTIDLQPASSDNIVSSTAAMNDTCAKSSGKEDRLSSRLKSIGWCSPSSSSNKLANRSQKSMEYLQRQFKNKSQQPQHQQQYKTVPTQIAVNNKSSSVNYQTECATSQIQQSQRQEAGQQLHAKQDFLTNQGGGFVNTKNTNNTIRADSKQVILCKGQEFADGQFGDGALKDYSLADQRTDSRIVHKLIFLPERLQQEQKQYQEHQQYSRQYSQHTPQLKYALHTSASVHSEYYPTSLPQSSLARLSENNSRSLLAHNEQQQQQQQEQHNNCIINTIGKKITHHRSQSPRSGEIRSRENSESVSFQEQIRKIMETSRHQRQIKVLERQFQNTKQGSGGTYAGYPKQQTQCALSSQGLIRKVKPLTNYKNNEQQSLL